MLEYIENREYAELYSLISASKPSELNDFLFEILERLLYTAENRGFDIELYRCIESIAEMMSSKERIICILSIFRDLKDPTLLNLLTKILCFSIDDSTQRLVFYFIY